MKVAFVLPNLPDLQNGGGGARMAGLIDFLRHRNHEIAIVSIQGKHASRTVSPDAIQSAKEAGIEIVSVGWKQKASIGGISAFLKTSDSFFAPAEAALRPEIHRQLAALAPDCVVAFSPDPLVYVQHFQDCPVLAIMSELPYLNMQTRRQYSPVEHGKSPIQRLKAVMLEWGQKRYDKKCLTSPTRLVFSAPHYQAWAKANGRPDAGLFRTSVADLDRQADCEETRRAQVPAPKPSILVIGHLHSTNNAAGLPILFDEIVPELDRRIGQQGYLLNIVGDHRALPVQYLYMKDHPAISFKGPVSPPKDEFLDATVTLVATPTRTGPRTRILTAFTLQSCIVAHQNNVLGIPELQDSENCLIGENSLALVDKILQAFSSEELRDKLGKNGRSLFDSLYRHDLAGIELESQLQLTIKEFNDRDIRKHAKRKSR